jgi:hypothetical protein
MSKKTDALAAIRTSLVNQGFDVDAMEAQLRAHLMSTGVDVDALEKKLDEIADATFDEGHEVPAAFSWMV